MTAEERALEAYPKETRDIGGIVVSIGYPQYMRDLYIEGYHQAEKDIRFDLIHKIRECKEKIESGFSNNVEIDIQDFKTEKNFELTWEDIKTIDNLEEAAMQYGTDEFPSLCNGCKHVPIDAFKAGAKWQKEKMMKKQ